MIAKIVLEMVYKRRIDWGHGKGCPIKRFVVEGKDNLAITPYDDRTDAFTGFDFNEDCKVIGEVEMSDELVEEALSFIRTKADAKARFNSFKGSFEALLG